MKQMLSVNEIQKHTVSTQHLTSVRPHIYGMLQVFSSGNPTASGNFLCIFLVLTDLIKSLMRTACIFLSLVRYPLLSDTGILLSLN